MDDLGGRSVLVYSLGKEGRDLASWLIERGARVTISDTRTDDALAAAGATPPAGIERVVTGQPLLDPLGFDLLAVSQSILRHDPAVVRARELGIPVTSQMQLFLRLCPATVVGITGSNGKSMTTALVGAIASAAGLSPVVGGNIGEPLLHRLGEITEDTTVILEISHTQLQYTDRSPRVAGVTNVTPNHLDQFGWDEYVGLKRNILEFQTAADVAVMNADDAISRDLMAAVRGGLLRASTAGDPGGDAAFLDGDMVRVRRDGDVHHVIERAAVRLRGDHNLANVVTAVGVAAAAGWPIDTTGRAIRDFRGLGHRLEPVGVAAGVLWVNDSIATTPDRTLAGLRSFDEPVVLLLGGREKHLPLADLAPVVRERCRAVVCFGEAREVFARAARDGGEVAVEVVGTVEEAVGAACRVARPGDVVLLSPAGTSFDAYPGFEARGDAFRRAVAALPGFVPSAV